MALIVYRITSAAGVNDFKSVHPELSLGIFSLRIDRAIDEVYGTTLELFIAVQYNAVQWTYLTGKTGGLPPQQFEDYIPRVSIRGIYEATK